MNKSILSLSASLLVTTNLIAGCHNNKERHLQKPNVLFIMCDDLNDYEGVFGGHPDIKTPNIDKLAESGVRFVNAQTNVPLCSPSRNCLFTGVYPHTSKDFGWTPHFKNPLLKECKTFVELFRENGYVTMGSGKLLHKDVNSIWDQWGVERRINYGPHAYNGTKAVGHPSVPEPFRSVNFVDGSFSPLSNTPVFPADQVGENEPGWTYGPRPFRYVSDDDRDLMPDEMHAKWAVKKIKELDSKEINKPFFMGVGFVKPHTPLYAPQKYFDMFPLDKIKLPEIKKNDIDDCFYKSVYPQSEMGLHYFQALKEAYNGDERGLKLFMQAYMACVAFVDDQIGKVLNALNESKFKDNTIVLLTSDHGWQMGEKDYLFKNSPWEESCRIPMIIRHPEFGKAGSKVSHPVSLIDIFPTFMDLCHLKGDTRRSSKGVAPEGYSLKPFLKNPNFNRWKGPDGALTMTGVGINKPIQGLAFRTNPKALWHVEITRELGDEYIMQQNYSYRTQNWRYIRYRNGKEELYDHRNDPYEWNNLALDNKYDKKKIELRKKVLKMINKKK